MNPELVSNFLLAGGVILVLITAFQIWRAVDLLTHGVRTEGRISRYTTEEREHWKGEGQGSETVRLDFPHVEFSLPDGSRVEFKSRLQKMTDKGLEQGSTVTVLYNPKAPAKTGEIVGVRTWFAILFKIVPIGIMAVGLLYYTARLRGWVS